MKTIKVTVLELSDMVGVTPATVRQALRDGNLYYPIVSAEKKGKSWNIFILKSYKQ